MFPLAIAGLVALLGWWGNGLLRNTVEHELKAQLTTTLEANVTALGIWSTNQTRLARAVVEDSEIRRAAIVILQTPPPKHREYDPPPQLDDFINNLHQRLPPLGYGIAQLVSTNFSVVANSMRSQWIGNNVVSDAHTNKFAELFATGQPVIITPFRPEMLVQRRAVRNIFGSFRTNGIPSPFYHPPSGAGHVRRGDVTLMQVAAPIRNYNNRIIGALALIINPDQEFSRILSVARAGASGETYAFDQTGLLISESRFDDQLKTLRLLDATNDSSALNLRLRDPGGDLTQGYKIPALENGQNIRSFTRLVGNALDGEEEVDVTPARDYRGVPVVGASCWLPQFGFGVATQIDADEAYRPLRILQLVFVVLVLTLLLCATGMFVFSCASHAWRERLDAAELKLKQLGQYTLEEKIGEGGMGVVYRARHALLRRDTAVKLLVPELADPGAVARFEREVRLTCQLTHPNTIQVYDYGHTPDGIFYYAMEYLVGVNLHDLVIRYGPLPEGRAVQILVQICDSLSEAHGLGLIHRDIKPGNVFLCRRGGVPECVKVLDFGLVKEFHPAGVAPAAVNSANSAESGGSAEPAGPTAAGDSVPPANAAKPGVEQAIEGTPWFTPPEAILGSAPADPRGDLYSLGALGYFLLTGCYIFDAESMAEIHHKQLVAPPVPPRQRTTNPISPEMEALLLRCLEKDMSRRPQSAAELRAGLLATPAANEWTLEQRAAWWEAYEHQPAAAAHVPPHPGVAAPMPSVSIDLAGRMDE
jgi:serine/threonine protein kinase